MIPKIGGMAHGASTTLALRVSVSGAGLVRYLYGAPIAVVLAFGYFVALGLPAPRLSISFFTFAATGGLAGIHEVLSNWT
jgi:hypothetical protein